LSRIFVPEPGTLAARCIDADESLAVLSQCIGADKALRKQWRLALHGRISLPDQGNRVSMMWTNTPTEGQ